MRKGLTPIIATIVLLLITVALAGVAWTYLSGFMATQMKTVTIPPNGAYCTASSVQVLVANGGIDPLTSADITVKSATRATTSTTVDGTLGATIASKGSGIVTFTCPAGTTPVCAGTWSVSIGTAGALQTTSVTCT